MTEPVTQTYVPISAVADEIEREHKAQGKRLDKVESDMFQLIFGGKEGAQREFLGEFLQYMMRGGRLNTRGDAPSMESYIDNFLDARK